MCKTAVTAGALVLSAVASADIVTLSAKVNVDNFFEAYLSNSATSLGTQFMSGNSWPTTFTGNVGINLGGTYYLHVRAVDQGAPAMFIGEFTLSNTDGVFVSTGGQSLLTSTTNFTASTGANPGDTAQPGVDLGANGTSPWGNMTQIASTARYLWAGSPQVGANIPVFFTTEIQVVPEPLSFSALGAGILVLLRKRRKSS
jgi:hypothetical protein